MPKERKSQQGGLATNSNHLLLPPGSLVEAYNLQFTAPGTMIKRPGFRGEAVDTAALSTNGQWAVAITDFDGYVIGIAENGGFSEEEYTGDEFYYGLVFG